MKFIKLVLIFSVFALFLAACASTTNVNTNVATNTATAPPQKLEATPAATDDLAAARKTYSEICVKCHKEDGKGGVRQIEDVKIKAPDFTSERMKKDEDAEWIKVIKNGEKEDGMPAFGDRLNDEEIKNLVKFIRREFQQK